MLKKSTGVLLLTIGGFWLWISTLMTGFVISSDILDRIDRKTAVLNFILLFVAPTALSILSGLALWDQRRWRIALGTVLTTVGSLSALGGMTFALLMLSPEIWEAAGVSKFPISLNLFGGSLIFIGVVLLGIGVPLIMKQKKLDGG